MLKFYIQATEALKRLRSDANGVVSFEYVIVAAAVVGAVVLAFGAAGGSGPISSALKSGIDAITTKITG
ncbi:Flp pilus assembly pilin Flp [Bradyrhizobium sp. USDA 4532]|uniref:hypothetical protein n=1 Tax=unclassified Bradyrhizobium TaxID=2631580 RepID=UPI00209DC772|nr:MULTISPECIES: hypothetical protein [unclassified Bradyrhizobium]MCP1834200.1 Flp pilus assembly pilin Flp [Bradyrhizobium sp. USDA 4545]MCP1918946.1 Flp pilus assembly pilin Flp [Bradyrhizobium sp. USDA 4532]